MERETLTTRTPIFLSTTPLEPFLAPYETGEPDDPTLRDLLGAERQRTLRKSRRKGLVQFVVADEIACALGYHPVQIWGDAWLEPVKQKKRKDVCKRGHTRVDRNLNSRGECVPCIQQRRKAAA